MREAERQKGQRMRLPRGDDWQKADGNTKAAKEVGRGRKVTYFPWRLRMSGSKRHWQ